MDYLKSDEKIEEMVIKFINDFKESTKKQNIYKEVLDPFSSIFEASIHGLEFNDWIEAETSRQTQKTLQNGIGDLHQKLLSNIKDVEDLGVGEIIDIVCHNKKIIAEIKNKYNTTKGNHKCQIYDDLEVLLNKPDYKDYIGYYVEIIPKTPKKYNKPFTPSDNKTGTNRSERKDIRQIDGNSFYTLLTGDPSSFTSMYTKVSKILVDKYNLNKPEEFLDLFNRAYIEGYEIQQDIENIEKYRKIQLINKSKIIKEFIAGDINKNSSLQWKHGECEFNAQMWRLKKEGSYKCPKCKTDINEGTI